MKQAEESSTTESDDARKRKSECYQVIESNRYVSTVLHLTACAHMMQEDVQE